MKLFRFIHFYINCRLKYPKIDDFEGRIGSASATRREIEVRAGERHQFHQKRSKVRSLVSLKGWRLYLHKSVVMRVGASTTIESREVFWKCLFSSISNQQVIITEKKDFLKLFSDVFANPEEDRTWAQWCSENVNGGNQTESLRTQGWGYRFSIRVYRAATALLVIQIFKTMLNNKMFLILAGKLTN